MPRILILDDDEPIREVLNAMLRRDGHVVASTGSGKAALQKIAEARFDIVFTDIQMPEMSGMEFIREAKRLYPTLRVIALSGGDDNAKEDPLMAAEHAGADASLKKPVRMDEVRRVVKEVLDGTTDPRNTPE